MSDVKLSWQGSRRLIDVERSIARGAWYVAEHRLRNMSKWWVSMLSFGVGNPVLFLLSVGVGIGALVNKNNGGIDGVDYLVFLAPALLATAAIQATMDETMFPVLSGFVWDKNFFAMNSTQLGGRAMVGGILIAAGIRNVLTVLVYEAILLLFGAVPLASVPMLTVSSVLAGFGFGAIMLMGSSFVKKDDGFFAIVGRFIITPMFMFSGTYYPLESLPIYLQWIGWFSPVWHATDLGRALSYGHSSPTWLLITHVAYLSMLFVVGLLVATWQFDRRLSK